MRQGVMRMVTLFRCASCKYSGWYNYLCLGRKLSEVNFFLHEQSRQWIWVLSGMFNNMREVEYTLSKGNKVGAWAEQSGV